MGPDDEVKPLQGKVFVAAFDGSPEGELTEIGYLSDAGVTPSFAVVDEVQEWKGAGALKVAANLTTTIQVQTYDTDLLGLMLYGGKKPQDIQPYIDQIHAYVHGLTTVTGIKVKPEPKPVPHFLHLPATVEGVPGDFPTVDLIGTPSPAKRVFVEQIGACDGFEQPKHALDEYAELNAAIVKHLSKVSLQIKPAFGNMYQAIEKVQKAFAQSAHAIGKAVDVMAPAMAEAAAASDSNVSRAVALRERIPGLDEIVKAPCSCRRPPQALWNLIQHLNDGHNPENAPPFGDFDPWSRERIADWLETLDVDLRVQDPPEFEVGQAVYARRSRARGTVVKTFSDGAEVMVNWRNGGTSTVSAFALVAGEPDPSTWDPTKAGIKIATVTGMGIVNGLKIGDWVQDISAGKVGHAGQIVAAKKSYDMNTDSNVIELKVHYTHDGSVLFQSLDQVEKIGPSETNKPWPSLADMYTKLGLSLYTDQPIINTTVTGA